MGCLMGGVQTEAVETGRIARFIIPVPCPLSSVLRPLTSALLVTQAVTTLASDPDKSVRMRCIDACGAVVVNVSDPEVCVPVATDTLLTLAREPVAAEADAGVV
jgi:hypothetical protein